MNATFVSYLGSHWTADGSLEVEAQVGSLDKELLDAITETVKATETYVIATDLSHVRPTVLELIAEDPETDVRTLTALASCEFETVREAVADNKNTPVSTLLLLAHDECADVRYQIAENHNVPAVILQILTEDENPYIRWRAETTLHRLH